MSVSAPDLSDHLQQPHGPRRYRVQVGFETVVVEAAGRQEAIQRARRILCQRHPRMWDIIQSLDPSRFRVVPLAEGTGGMDPQ